jgi:membrane-bound serine protease (ClpP class)
MFAAIPAAGRRLVWLTCVAALLSSVWAGLPAPTLGAEIPRVYALRIHGVISQLTADQVIRVADAARDDQAAVLLLEVNSPGGGESAVRDIVRAVLASSIPVIVYIGGDAKAQALSGAMYIALAADVAVMSPDATMGIALPTGLSDRAAEAEREARIERAIQIAADASSRPRDPNVVAEAVRSNHLFTAAEALSQGLIDQISADVPALLSTADGKTVQTPNDSVTISSEGARVVWMTATLRERLLGRITDPNVAYVLLSLGITLLIWELFNPGRFIAGIPGVVALVAAFIAFGNMPTSWLGLGLIIAGALALIRELYTPKLTVLGPVGVIAYLAGSFALYRPVRQTSAIAPAVQVSLPVIVITVAVMILVLLAITRSLYRVRRGGTPRGVAALVGAEGVVIEPLTPRGVVRVLGQEWAAVGEQGDVAPGTAVRIRAIEAGVLRVLPLRDELSVRDRSDGSITEPGD